MRPTSLTVLFPLLLTSVLAQSSGLNQTYIAGLIATFEDAGLTALAGVLPGAINTTTGTALFTDLPNGNKTVFAPTDAGFNSTTIPSSQTEIADVVALHIIPGTFPNSSVFATFPNTTVLRTSLNDSNVVALEGNKSQVIVVANEDSKINILNQPKNTTVSKTLSYENLVIHVINGVLRLPQNLSTVITSQNLTALAGAAQQAGLAQAAESAHGITIFAPNDKAFTTALASLGSQSTNITVLQAVLGNHIINGTSVYTPEFNGGKFTSASGEGFTLVQNSTGTFVTSGNSTAKVIKPDIPTSNGVVHIIDTVLANTATNPSAASSAFNSATAAAGTSPTSTPTGAVGSGAERSAMAASVLVGVVGICVALAF